MVPEAANIDFEAKRAAVVGAMIASIRRGEDREYYVGLVGYYIDGIPYPASGLTVDLTATPDIYQTDGGFACTAYFPPSMLQPSTVKKNGIVRRNLGDRVEESVEVILEAKLIDIWAIAEFIKGTQHDLFQDQEAFVSRQQPFLAEMGKFFEAVNSKSG